MVDWGAMAAASADQVNGILNYFSNEHANQTNLQYARETNEANIALARENNAFQERMVGVNNAFSHDEAALSREFNAREAEKQRAWESEQAKVRRLEAAGLNPALAFQGGGTAQAATSTPASPHGSGVTPSLPNLVTPHYQAFQFQSPSESIKNMADAFAAMASAKKQGVETDTLEKTQEDVMRRYKAEGDLAELTADLERRTMDKKRDYELKQMDMNLYKTGIEIYAIAKEGDFNAARKRLTDLQSDTQEEVRRMTKANADIAEKENQHWFELFSAKLNNLESQTGLNKASAENQHEQAVSEDRLREVRKNLFSSQQKEAENAALELAEIARNYAIRNGMLPNEMNWMEIQRMYMQQIREDLKSKQFENTWTGRFLHSLAAPAFSGSAAAAIRAGAMP